MSVTNNMLPLTASAADRVEERWDFTRSILPDIGIIDKLVSYTHMLYSFLSLINSWVLETGNSTEHTPLWELDAP